MVIKNKNKKIEEDGLLSYLNFNQESKGLTTIIVLIGNSVMNNTYLSIGIVKVHQFLLFQICYSLEKKKKKFIVPITEFHILVIDSISV